MMKSKAIARKVFASSNCRLQEQAVLTEKEGGIEKAWARLGDRTYAQLVIPLGDHNEHSPIKETPMRQAEDSERCDNDFLTIPKCNA